MAKQRLFPQLFKDRQVECFFFGGGWIITVSFKYLEIVYLVSNIYYNLRGENMQIIIIIFFSILYYLLL